MTDIQERLIAALIEATETGREATLMLSNGDSFICEILGYEQGLITVQTEVAMGFILASAVIGYTV